MNYVKMIFVKSFREKQPQSSILYFSWEGLFLRISNTFHKKKQQYMAILSTIFKFFKVFTFQNI